MATYNGEKYLREQLDSILSQTIKVFELIVCDDCSSDSTVMILKEYSTNDSRIKIFTNERRLGYVKNFEKAILLCSGKYIALSDQDDFWLPEHLEILYKEIVTGKYDLVGGNAILVDANNKEIGGMLITNGVFPKSKEEWQNRLLHKNLFQGAALMFSRDILEKALPFPTKIGVHDWWLALVASECKGVSYIDTAILRYRQHGNNVTGNHPQNTVFQRIKKFFSNNLKSEGQMREALLENFLRISVRETRVTESLSYAKLCTIKSPRIIPYFIRHYDEIYGKGCTGLFVVRVAKIIFDILLGRKL